MNPTQAHLICIRNGLKVVAEPYKSTFGWVSKIHVLLNDKPIHKSDKALRSPEDVNNAMERAVVYLANKL